MKIGIWRNRYDVGFVDDSYKLEAFNMEKHLLESDMTTMGLL